MCRWCGGQLLGRTRHRTASYGVVPAPPSEETSTRRDSQRVLGTTGVALMAFFLTAAGPFGYEDGIAVRWPFVSVVA